MIDPNILLQSKPVEIETPLQAQQQVATLSNIRNANLQGQQNLQSGALDLQAKQRAFADQTRNRAGLARAMGLNPDGSPTAAAPAAAPAPSVVTDPTTGQPLPSAPPPAPAAPAAAPAAPAVAPAVPTVRDLMRWGVTPEAAPGMVETFQKQAEGAADLQKKTNDLNDAVTEQQSGSAAAIIKSGLNPAVIAHQLQTFASSGPAYAAKAQALAQSLQGKTPDQQQAIFQSIADQSTKVREAGAAESTAGSKVSDAALLREKNFQQQRGSTLGQATDQPSWDAATLAMARAGDDMSKIPVTFSPAAAQQYSDAGKTPAEIATEKNAAQVRTDTEARDANTALNEAASRRLQAQSIGIAGAHLGIDQAQLALAQKKAGPGGDDALAGMSGGELQRIKLIADGAIPAPPARSAAYKTTMDAVLQMDPSYTESRYLGKKSFNTGGDANNLVSVTTALSHLDRAKVNSAAMGGFASLTSGANVLPSQKRYNSDIDLATGEIGKLVKAGVVTQDESKKMISNVSSPSQASRDAGLDELTQLMNGKFEGIRQKYKNATNQEIPLSKFDTQTQARMVGLGVDSGAAAQGAPIAAAAPAAPAAPAAGPAGKFTVTDPNGGSHVFATAAQANTFKKLARIP
jgi:hypothetical protein